MKSKYDYLNSIDSWKSFIREKNILSRKDLSKRFGRVYQLFNSLSKENKDILLPTKNDYCDYSNLNNKEDFIKLVNKYNITDRDGLSRKFYKAFKRFNEILSAEEQYEVIPHKNKDYSYLLSKLDFYEFIKINKITSKGDFSLKFPGAYCRFIKNLTKEEQDELLPSKFNDYNLLISEDGWIKFIEENQIKSRYDLYKRFPGAHYKLINNYSEEFRDKILPITTEDYSELIDKNSMFKFIKENQIESRYDFYKRFHAAYVKFLNILTKDEQEELLPLKGEQYSYLNNKTDFLNFISLNKLNSRADLSRFPGALRRFYLLLTEEEQEEILPTLENKSSGELYLMKLFEGYNIEYVQEKKFSNLKDKTYLRYDFYLEKYNIIVEYHGAQHFDEKNNYFTKDIVTHDRIKYDYAINNKITILYFTREKDIYYKYGYFTEVITDPDIIINKIKEIGLTNQSLNTND